MEVLVTIGEMRYKQTDSEFQDRLDLGFKKEVVHYGENDTKVYLKGGIKINIDTMEELEKFVYKFGPSVEVLRIPGKEMKIIIDPETFDPFDA